MERWRTNKLMSCIQDGARSRTRLFSRFLLKSCKNLDEIFHFPFEGRVQHSINQSSLVKPWNRPLKPMGLWWIAALTAATTRATHTRPAHESEICMSVNRGHLDKLKRACAGISMAEWMDGWLNGRREGWRDGRRK